MDFRETEQTPGENDSVDIAAPDEQVNRVPAAAALMVVLVWAGFSVFLRNIIRLPLNVTELVWGILIALLGFAVLPVLTARLTPGSASRTRRLVRVGALVLFLIPLAVSSSWIARDALHPVAVRTKQQLPDLAGMVGSNRRDAERMLGDAIMTGEYKVGSGPASVLKGIGAARSVGYALPDLNRLDRRPSKQQELGDESQQTVSFLRSLALAPPKGDAQVVVYYASDGKVVGALLELSLLAARDVLSDVTTATVLRASGFGEDARYGQGRTTAGGRTLDYYVRLEGGSSLTVQSSGDVQRDLGDVLVFVSQTPAAGALGLSGVTTSVNEAPRSSVSSGSSGTSEQGKTTPAPAAAGRSSHSDQRFWIIVCAEGLSEEEARAQADRLNANWAGKSRENPNPFAVERSGHLQGVTTHDWWLVIYDMGYGEAGDAQTQVGRLGMPLALEARVVQITKVCGDPTIAEVVR